MNAPTACLAEQFAIELDADDGCAVVLRLRGELDLASVPELGRQLSMVEAKDPQSLTIDLRELAFMDSTGLRALLVARQRALEADRELVLVRGAPVIHRVFTTTGTDALFAFADDASERAVEEHAGHAFARGSAP